MTLETSPGGDRDWKRRLSSRLARRSGAGTETDTPLTLPGQKGPEVVFTVGGEARAKPGWEGRGASEVAGSGEKVLTGVGPGNRKDRGGRREVFVRS